jgi:hypothetical protein
VVVLLVQGGIVTAPACTFIVSAFNRPTELKLCLLSLVLQTRIDWLAIVTDNANSSTYRDLNEEAVRWVGDDRIQHHYTGDRANNCYASAEIGASIVAGGWLGFPSDDSYFVSEYLERMLEVEQDLDCIYSDVLYDRRLAGRRAVLSTEPREGCIDKTAFLVRREKFIGFPDQPADGSSSSADGKAIERMVAMGYRMRKIDECLVVHS